jgi:predicted Zn-dependent peptidase
MNLNRHTAPAIEFVKGISPVEPEIARLDNGIPVYLIHSTGQDLVKIELLLEAGKWYEDKPLVANFTSKMLKEGTRTLSAAAIANRIDYYGAHLENSVDKDMSYVSLYTLNKHLEQTLPLVADVVLDPIFPADELETLRQNRRQRFIVNNQKVRFLAKRKFSTLIYGDNHPYGKTFETADFDHVAREDLVHFHRDRYTADRCKIIVAGNIRPGFMEMLNQQFAAFREKGREPGPPAPVNDSNKGQKSKIEKKDALQSAIRIGRVLFNKTHPDYARLKVLNTLLGGYFGSRLMTNIREEKGYTYGIGSAIVSHQQSGYFFIASEVGTEVTTDAIGEVYHEIERLQQDLVPEQELSLVKNYMLGSFLRSMDGAFALSENYKGLIEYGLDYEYLRKFVEVVRGVSADELRELARTYLDTSTLSELVVGKPD